MAVVPAAQVRRRWGTFAALGVATIVSLQAQARRIISIVPATTEMLFAMGAGNRLVADGSYDRFPPEAEKLPHVGALLDPDVERIIALRPDLVILYGSQTELRTQLERASIPFYPYTHRGLADITETIRSLGARVGAGPQGEALASRIEQELQEIRGRVATRPRPKTLLLFGRDRRSLADMDASGGYGFLHDMLEAAGGTDVMSDVHQQSVMMTTEMVLARAPEVIIELSQGAGNSDAEPDIRAWNALPSIPAVKTGRVYLLRGQEFVVPGPRVSAATMTIARLLHPEAF